jgi:hypothetical protein
MGLGLFQTDRQLEVHTSAWSTYVPRRQGKGLDPDDLRSRRDALRSLHERLQEMRKDGDRSELMLTATAVWNLLNVYRNGNAPKEFCELLLAVLALDVDRAREMHAQPAHRVFPPFPEDPYIDDETYALYGGSALVSDSSFEVGKNRKKKTDDEQADEESTGQKAKPFRSRARLELCVNRNFERLNVLSAPMEWPELCPVIWRGMKGDGDTFKGKLRLPGVVNLQRSTSTSRPWGDSRPMRRRPRRRWR